MAEYHSIRELLEICECGNQKIWEAVMEQEAAESGLTEEQVFQKMERMYEAMRLADENYDAELRSGSGAAGGDGEKIRAYNASGKNLCSPYTSLAMEKALKMAESNACMKRIVAAPTAGSCGVIPAVVLSYEDSEHASKEEIVQALFVTAGIGKVIAENASIAGASGGCQAEIGSASAMAAGAQLAMAGIRSAITPDDTIDSMRRIGNDLPVCLKETSTGGLAVTESAKRILEKISKKNS